MIALNSNCSDVAGGCKAGSPQETWLKADLAAHPNQCTLAYWHHPRWNSGALGNDSATAAFWTDLYNAHADVVLVGHGNHHYERQAPQTAAGVPSASGIRQFIVSTGGEEHGTPPATPGDQDRLEVADYTSFGVLRMTLHATSYDWQFVPEVGGSFTDSGSGTCHSAPITQVPGAPSASATADSAVHVAWNAPSSGGAPITSYKLYRGTSPGAETLYKTLGNVTSYDDTAVAAGTKYYYRVSAVNSAGEGAQSNEVSATPASTPPPPADFPSTSTLDDFARTAGTLGANWQSPGLADPGTVTIETNGVTKSASGASTATWKASTFAADQEAFLSVPTLPKAGSFMQVAGRISTLGASGVSCYFVKVTPSTSKWELRKKFERRSLDRASDLHGPVPGRRQRRDQDRRLDDHRLPQEHFRHLDPCRIGDRHSDPRCGLRRVHARRHHDAGRSIRGRQHHDGPAGPEPRRAVAFSGGRQRRAPVVERSFRRGRADHRLQRLPRHRHGGRDAAEERRERDLLRRHGRRKRDDVLLPRRRRQQRRRGHAVERGSRHDASPRARAAGRADAVGDRRHRRAPFVERSRRRRCDDHRLQRSIAEPPPAARRSSRAPAT